MEFEDYVPEAVRTYISTQIEGDSRVPDGWAAALVNAEEKLSKIEAALVEALPLGNSESLDSLREQKTKAVKGRDMLANSIDCLKRLAQDKRMCKAFKLLAGEFSDDEHRRSFISSAWAAQMDYIPYLPPPGRSFSAMGAGVI